MKVRLLLAWAVALLFAPFASAQIIVSDWGGRLTAYDVAGNSSNVINGMQNMPNGMAMGPDGLLYVADSGSNTVNRYNPVTGQFVSTAISSAQLGASFVASGLTFLPNGDLLVADQAGIFGPALGSGSVYRFNFGSNMLTPLLTGLNQPIGLLYNNGNLYISEVSNVDPNQARISRYDFVNPPTTFLAHSVSGLNQPTGLVVGPDGQMYVTDVMGFNVRRVDFTNPTNNSVFASGSGFIAPTGVVFSGGHMFVSNYGTGAMDGFLSEFNATTGAFEQIAVSGLVIGSAVVTVPEPASFMLIGLPAGVFVLRRLRNRRKD